MEKLLSGNEAVARGAYECGCTFATAYPGTPSTEILETLSRFPGIEARWAPNEKVAYETAVGACLGGARALVSMKHVGLNVAADPFFSHSYMGVVGGLVVVSADDPGLHSSQNEQDNRWLARAAKVPMLEPSTSAEAKAFVRRAFEISEEFDTPVLLRLTTRVCHSVGQVEVDEPTATERRTFQRNFRKFVLLPVHARQRHVAVEDRIDRLARAAEGYEELNRIVRRGDELGVVSSGAAWLYAMECFPEASHLKLGLTNPLPSGLVRSFASSVGRLVVVEEGDPFLEERLRVLGLEVSGQDLRPRTGELNLDLVSRMGNGGEKEGEIGPGSGLALPPRPPVLCPGCSHRGVFTALDRLDLIVMGDIGCYTLGALPPLSTMDTCLCMGASMGMTSGLDRVLPEVDRRRLVGVIGDSTFLHSGLTGLIDAVYNRSAGTYIVLDNRITAMTGHQPHPGSGKGIDGKEAPRVDIPALVRSIGIERVRTTGAYELLDLEKTIREEVEVDEPSVIVVEDPCVLHERKIYGPPVTVREDLCTHCESCLSVGCPAIGFAERTPVVAAEMCNGCGVCQQVCYNCPAANDVAGFLQLTVEKRYGEALRLLLKSNPFPAITGRVCPHPCELEFNTLGLQLEGVYDGRFSDLAQDFGNGDGRRFSVRAVERFLGDYGLDQAESRPRPEARRAERVGVVGSGPAGLTCAYYLAERGFTVTVYEQLPEIGGMLRAGIPDFRLPRDILDKNLARLRDLGVEFRTGVAVGEDRDFDEVRRGHDALFLATGFSDPRPIGISGQEHKEVLHGLHLLRDINLGEPPELGKRMLVVGGGNTALDVARSVKKLGTEATIAYRRALDDMPAIEEEVRAIQREGIPIVPYAAPVKIEKEGGCLKVTLVKMQPGPFDESGRRRPVPVPGSEYFQEYDQVATAVGETAGLSSLPPELEHDQRLVTTDFSNATNIEGLFAGGDLSTGFGTVAHAIRSGRKGAEAIAVYLAGK